MEVISNKVYYKNLKSNMFSSTDFAFMDIETTGLNRNNNIIYLIGVLFFNREEKSWEIRQFFAKDLKSEVKILEKSLTFLSNFSKIVNYNGNSFDIPFLNHRADLFSIDLKIKRENSLDIYSFLRQNRDFIEVKNLKLKTIEEHLGIYREDIYTGKDCIGFYKDYLLSRNKGSKEKILKHNFDDLYFLPYLFPILEIIEREKTITIENYSDPLSFHIDKIQIVNDFLFLSLKTKEAIKNKLYFFQNNYKIVSTNNYELEINIELKKGLVDPIIEAYYVENSLFGIEKAFANNYNYKVPSSYTLIKIDKKYHVDNIKALLKILINKALA